MAGKIINRGNFSLWIFGQIVALSIGASVSIQHDWTLGCAAGFIVMVLVDIRGQL